MTSKGNFKDARLLEALEYIDVDLVGEVAAKLRIEQSNTLTEEPVMTWRTPFKHWKRMLATVACLLLLSAAFPVVSYVLPMIGVNTDTPGGNAGAGSSAELESQIPTETQSLETEPEMTEADIIDSGFDKALERYADMSAEEIYADVLKGGWGVIDGNRSDFAAGGELWYNFYEKSQKGESAYVLIAEYNPNYIRDDIKEPVIFLREIVFDGTLYYHKCIFSLTKETVSQGEYKFLKKDQIEYTANGKDICSEAYFLTNNDMWTWQQGYNEIFSSTIPEKSFWKENVVPVVINKN